MQEELKNNWKFISLQEPIIEVPINDLQKELLVNIAGSKIKNELQEEVYVINDKQFKIVENVE